MEILTVENKKNEKFLRRKTITFDFQAHKKKDVRELITVMRRAMREANGIGLSANQIGLPYRVFVAQVPDSQGKLKFYAVFNPEILKQSQETDILEEGCLSVPHLYGLVERSSRVTLAGQDQNGRNIKVKAWGLLARVFQHEVDHLEGKIFIDRTKPYPTPTSERLQDREKKMQK